MGLEPWQQTRMDGSVDRSDCRHVACSVHGADREQIAGLEFESGVLTVILGTTQHQTLAKIKQMGRHPADGCHDGFSGTVAGLGRAVDQALQVLGLHLREWCKLLHLGVQRIGSGRSWVWRRRWVWSHGK